jgi:hypothetical protein
LRRKNRGKRYICLGEDKYDIVYDNEPVEEFKGQSSDDSGPLDTARNMYDEDLDYLNCTPRSYSLYQSFDASLDDIEDVKENDKHMDTSKMEK